MFTSEEKAVYLSTSSARQHAMSPQSSDLDRQPIPRIDEHAHRLIPWGQWSEKILEGSSRWSIQLLRSFFGIRGSDRVNLYLQLNPNLLDTLIVCGSKIPSYFPHSPLILSVIEDYEEEDFESLIVYIQTHLTATEALSRMDSMDSDWWLETWKQSDGKLSVNFEFLDAV